MYLLIENQTNSVTATGSTAYDSTLGITDVFPQANAQAFTMAWHEGTVPQHFKIDEQGKLATISLDLTQKVVNNEIVAKTLQEQVNEGILSLDIPFEYIENNTIKLRTIQQVVDHNHITTQGEADAVLDRIRKSIDAGIAEQYSIGYEMKLTKAYMDWVVEGQPANDERATDYQAMQTHINGVKATYQAAKDTVKALKNSLP